MDNLDFVRIATDVVFPLKALKVVLSLILFYMFPSRKMGILRHQIGLKCSKEAGTV